MSGGRGAIRDYGGGNQTHQTDIAIHPIKTIALSTWHGWNAHHTQRIGAALAYYTAFSMAPILIIALAVAGSLFGPDVARGELGVQLRDMLGTTGAEAVQEMLANTNRSESGVIATVVGTVTLLLGASSLFAELQGALNLIWDAPPPPKVKLSLLFRARMVSFAMVLMIGLLLLISLVISAGLSALQSSFGGFTSSTLLGTVLLSEKVVRSRTQSARTGVLLWCRVGGFKEPPDVERNCEKRTTSDGQARPEGQHAYRSEGGYYSAERCGADVRRAGRALVASLAVGEHHA